MELTFTISEEHAGKRLDAYLAETMEGISRSRIQKRIKDGTILLNGDDAKAHTLLAQGDVIAMPDDVATPVDPDAPPLPRPDIEIAVIHEDPAFVVIDKPAGLIVHPAVPEDTDTLANALIARYPEMEGIGESPERPGIMHRLDREASGLLVVARNQDAYEKLKKQFKEHTILKEYAVLVHGAPVEDEGTIDLAVGRVKGTGKMAAHATVREGDRPAVTHYATDESYTAATLLTVRTETGRMHQIRVHMKALGNPIAGDVLYGSGKLKPLPTRRLFLHAKTLAFDHPVTGERVTFTSELPEELKETLKKLKKR